MLQLELGCSSAVWRIRERELFIMVFYILLTLLLFVAGIFLLRVIVSKPEERSAYRKSDIMRFLGLLAAGYILIQILPQ
jgi:DMSO/TMAO reductase YedYZ heme-binding membrane subunit